MNTSILEKDIRFIAPRERAEWSIASGLAALLAITGVATLLQWAPVAEVFAVWGLPRWALFAVGIGEVVAAALVIFESTAFYASVAVAVTSLAGVVLYARNAPLPLALIPGSLLVFSLCEVVARAHVVREQLARTRRVRVTSVGASSR